ncbi:DUF6113 family protein [Actinomadura rupiterrae]|uniref:DUF6113 family protein n=1 Tax=Actinomadura rupiterrae TaxID=559627 RepID=UPI0020A61209|nr:DUF6113 family protein [Actinomadura rupiterrae]MCP2336630.1 hypothetical protein [Actinomadura rupiterrae]
MNEDDATSLRTGERAAPPAPATGPPPALYALVSGLAYGMLAALGAVAGTVGSFCQDWSVASLPLPSVGLCVLLFGLVLGAGFGMGGKLGGVAPAAAWMIVTFVMSSKQAEGDLVIPGTMAGYVYIIGGMVAALVAIAVVPSRREPGQWLTGQWLTGGGGDTRG